MRKLSFIAVMVLLVIASCTKKAAPTVSTGPKEPAIDGTPIYTQNCARCHGANGTGERGPDLTKTDYDKAGVTDAIFNGGGRMPSFGDKLTSKEISAVADFVLHLKK